ncbi:hypothetical protein A2160_00970 [Candidatus Beckwithbacteria bacterium RBG_13_42_9]|uniref:Uncharacterized protein n=1 Tax=Candidatus Beckwithbacteria bacterium RBG_13_42_9 TaxID=1797457 RepID=A0A1F5E348_9BACT|nr:MAG: hypothetical protein A2160_00970 [Candidatus Beckwithbacteria bacterium RBG_13_42_9]
MGQTPAELFLLCYHYVMDQNLPAAGNLKPVLDQPVSQSNDDDFWDTNPPEPTLTDDIVQTQQDLANAAPSQGAVLPPVTPPPAQPAQPISGPKEQQELGPVAPEPDLAPLIEQKEPEPEADVKDWLRKLEEGENVNLPQPITDDFGQTLVQAAGSQEAKIILPLDEEELQLGLHQKAANSIRWLAEWCMRVMKLAAGRVFYKAD